MTVVVAILGVALGVTLLLRGESARERADEARAAVTRLQTELLEKEDLIEALNARLAAHRRDVPELTATLPRTPAARESAAEPSEPAATDPGSKTPGSTAGATERELAALAWLRRLKGDRFAMDTPTALRELTHLDLRGAKVTNTDLAHLAAMPGLTSLNLRGTEVTDAGLRHLAALPNLQFVTLRGAQVTGAGFANLPVSLLHVDLTDTPVGATGWHALPPLPNMATLKLNRVPVTDADLEMLVRWPQVRHLEIDGTKVTEHGVRRLLALNPALTRLEVRGTPISDELRNELRRRYPNLDLATQDAAADQRRIMSGY